MKAIQTPKLSIVIVNYGSWPDVIAQIQAIQTSTPFEPLPGIYDLSRLNIVASFHCKITD